MDSKEIEERLAKGELLYCPECDIWHDDEGQGVCEIIMCANPFIGYSELDIEAHSKLITKNFNKLYNQEEVDV